MPSTVRAFVGLSIPTYLSNKLNTLAEDMAMFDRNQMNWVAQENYHVTLLFLGNQTMRWLEDFAEELDDNLTLQSPLLSATEISPFPLSSPKFLAAMLEPNKALIKMQKQVKMAAEQLGFTAEKKRFRPHITLARKFPRTGQLAIPTLNSEMSDHSASLIIYESKLSPTGASYYPIFEFNLN